jgi:hypothetical protein
MVCRMKFALKGPAAEGLPCTIYMPEVVLTTINDEELLPSASPLPLKDRI